MLHTFYANWLLCTEICAGFVLMWVAWKRVRYRQWSRHNTTHISCWSCCPRQHRWLLHSTLTASGLDLSARMERERQTDRHTQAHHTHTYTRRSNLLLCPLSLSRREREGGMGRERERDQWQQLKERWVRKSREKKKCFKMLSTIFFTRPPSTMFQDLIIDMF